MVDKQNRRRGPCFTGRVLFSALGVILVLFAGPVVSGAAPPGAYSTQHDITVDPTALTPPTRWHLPGVTPMITSMDPDTTDAYSTTERRVVKLRPGKYRFGTFTFDFPFVVTLDGVLDFAKSLNQCVEGRGTKTLTVRCSRMQPYGGDPEY